MLRLTLLVLGGPVLFLLLVQSVQWLRGPVPAPAEPLEFGSEPRFPGYGRIADEVLERFRRLPQAERQRTREEIGSKLLPIEHWARAHAGAGLICLGEEHRTATRRFIAERLAPNLAVDLLALEATESQVAALRLALGEGRGAELLGAPIDGLIRAVAARNPDVEIVGVEETPGQQQARAQGQGSRDASIRANLLGHVRDGRQHLVLLGALHCVRGPNGILGATPDAAAGALEPAIAVRVVGERQDGAVESFVNSLHRLGLEPQDFVLSRTDSGPLLAAWFPMLHAQLISRYDALVVFRQGQRPPRPPPG